MMNITPINDFSGYFASTDGTIFSARSCVSRGVGGGRGSKIVINMENIRKVTTRIKRGYPVVTLCINQKLYSRYVHRLILETFVGKRPHGMEACHNNGIRTDNRLENLRWDTAKNNATDKKNHGTDPVGERNPAAKISNNDVILIKELLNNSSMTQRRIGELFGICQVAISEIKLGKTWSSVK